MLPIVSGLIKNDHNNYQLAENDEDLKLCTRATKEAGEVLRALGFKKRQPFKLNLWYWLPELMVVKGYQRILASKFAEIAFAMHARAAVEEFSEHIDDFRTLIRNTSVATPNFDLLMDYVTRENN